jgi:hypothetical protein
MGRIRPEPAQQPDNPATAGLSGYQNFGLRQQNSTIRGQQKPINRSWNQKGAKIKFFNIVTLTWDAWSCHCTVALLRCCAFGLGVEFCGCLMAWALAQFATQCGNTVLVMGPYFHGVQTEFCRFAVEIRIGGSSITWEEKRKSVAEISAIRRETEVTFKCTMSD